MCDLSNILNRFFRIFQMILFALYLFNFLKLFLVSTVQISSVQVLKNITYYKLSTLSFLSYFPACITAEGRCAFTATATFLPVFDSGCRLI